jgi:hypothetical protein
MLRDLLTLTTLLMLLASCSKTEIVDAPTQITARVASTDVALRERLTHLRVSVSLEEAGGWKSPVAKTFEESELNWPVDFAIVPRVREDIGKRFQVVVEALADDQVLAETRAISSFLRDARRVLPLSLYLCPGHEDESGYVCAASSCSPTDCRVCSPTGECLPVAVVDPTQLAPLLPSEPESGDAGSEADASTAAEDAATDDGATGSAQEYALGAEGQPCAELLEQTLACEGHASQKALKCEQGTWRRASACAASERCDSRVGPAQGTCAPIAAACVGKSAGEICDGTVRLVCAADLITATPSACQEHAHCLEQAGKVRCGCDDGYQDDGTGKCVNGSDCPAQACTGGSCMDGLSDYSCNCDSGFAGTGTKSCRPVQYCPKDACTPGGDCVDQASWSCACAPGFTGTGTQACSAINDCPMDRCQAPNTCKDGVNSYTCSCATGFSGPDCVNDICTPNPCRNGGTCSRTGTLCTCAAGYMGPNCTQCAAGYTSNGSGGCTQTRTLTLTVTGDGFGTISFNNGVQACVSSCTRTVNSGITLTLTAAPAGYSRLVSWSEAGCSGNTCNVVMDANKTVTVKINLIHNVAFVTSAHYAAPSLGGLAAADAECTRLAQAAGLEPRTWRAFLSTQAPCPGQSTGPCHAADRLGSARGWTNRVGEPVADTVDAIRNNRFIHAIRYTERGEQPFGSTMTGSELGRLAISSGSSVPNNCGDFGSTSGYVTWGNSNGVGATAITANAQACNADYEYTMYCFSTNLTQALSIPAPPANARLAFESKAMWVPNGGLSGADGLCQREACQAGLTGSSNCTSSLGTSRTFRAWLSTTSASARSRFSATGGDYYRLDNVRWMAASALSAPDATPVVTTTGLNVAADGTFPTAANTMTVVWTGDDRTRTCNNWSSNANTALAEFGSDAFTGDWGFRMAGEFSDPWRCSEMGAIYCLQQ